MEILFFSPYAAIWKHASPEIDLAIDLETFGNKVTFVRCDNQLDDYCIAMSGFGLRYEDSSLSKLSVCKRCARTSNFVSEKLNFPTVYFSDFGSISTLNSEVLEKVNPQNWGYFEFEGIPIGKYAAYEFLLHHKISSREIPVELFHEYKSALLHALYIATISRKVLESTMPDRVVVYNKLYSTNRIFCEVADKLGIPTFSFQAAGPANSMHEFLSLEKNSSALGALNKSESWESVRNFPLTHNEVKFVGEHLRSLISSANFWVYSKPTISMTVHELRSKLGIPEGRKILLLATSSEDERNAVTLTGVLDDRGKQSTVFLFRNQFEWIAKVVEEFRDDPDYFLIVRIHPREFPNQRDSIASEAGGALIDVIRKLSAKSLYLNLPEDNLSIYNFVPLVDILLTGYSSVGIDFAAFDVPVISHENFELGGYPDGLVILPINQENYLSTIRAVSRGRNDIEVSSIAFRWLNYRYSQIARSFETWSFSKRFPVLRLLLRVNFKFGLPIPFTYVNHLKKRVARDSIRKSVFSSIIESGNGGLSRLLNVKQTSLSDMNLEKLYIREMQSSLMLTLIGDGDRTPS